MSCNSNRICFFVTLVMALACAACGSSHKELERLQLAIEQKKIDSISFFLGSSYVTSDRQIIAEFRTRCGLNKSNISYIWSQPRENGPNQNGRSRACDLRLTFSDGHRIKTSAALRPDSIDLDAPENLIVLEPDDESFFITFGGTNSIWNNLMSGLLSRCDLEPRTNYVMSVKEGKEVVFQPVPSLNQPKINPLPPLLQ